MSELKAEYQRIVGIVHDPKKENKTGIQHLYDCVSIYGSNGWTKIDWALIMPIIMNIHAKRSAHFAKSKEELLEKLENLWQALLLQKDMITSLIEDLKNSLDKVDFSKLLVSVDTGSKESLNVAVELVTQIKVKPNDTKKKTQLLTKLRDLLDGLRSLKDEVTTQVQALEGEVKKYSGTFGQESCRVQNWKKIVEATEKFTVKDSTEHLMWAVQLLKGDAERYRKPFALSDFEPTTKPTTITTVVCTNTTTTITTTTDDTTTTTDDNTTVTEKREWYHKHSDLTALIKGVPAMTLQQICDNFTPPGMDVPTLTCFLNFATTANTTTAATTSYANTMKSIVLVLLKNCKDLCNTESLALDCFPELDF